VKSWVAAVEALTSTWRDWQPLRAKRGVCQQAEAVVQYIVVCMRATTGVTTNSGAVHCGVYACSRQGVSANSTRGQQAAVASITHRTLVEEATS
jgi:hypothetical protein